MLPTAQPTCSSRCLQSRGRKSHVAVHAAQFETRRIKVLVKEESKAKTRSTNNATSKVLLQGSDKAPLFTASRKDWMPNGLVEVRKKQPQAAKKQSKPQAKSSQNGEKEVDIGPFVVLGVVVAAVLYHVVVPH
jgi:hypothetical protein